MFERFTKKARRVVVLAMEEAREQGVAQLGTEQLLVALFAVPDGLARTVLDGHGVTRADVEAEFARRRAGTPSDAAALATLGIDLDEVRRQVEDAFGPGALDRTRAARDRHRYGSGHLPFALESKKVLELALREAVRMRHDHIGTEHVLLGLLHPGCAAQEVLEARAVRLEPTRIVVDELVRGRRAS